MAEAGARMEGMKASRLTVRSAEPMQTVWIALRATERAVLEEVTLEHLVTGPLPARVRDLAGQPGSWQARPAHQP